MLWPGLHNPQCTCVQWEMTAKPTFGIWLQAETVQSTRHPFWNTRRTIKFPTCHGLSSKRNGLRFATSTNFKCFVCDNLWTWFFNLVLWIEITKNGSIDQTLGDKVIDALFVFHLRNKDDLGVAATNLLKGFQISDLHSCLCIELLSCHPHQLGWFDVSTGWNDLALSQSPLFGSAGKRILKVLA